jgi:hypothetical protein
MRWWRSFRVEMTMSNKSDIDAAQYWQNATASFESGVIAEPLLLFGGHRSHIDPKTGLSLYGPYTVSDQEHPPLTSITVGFVGPSALLSAATNWVARCQTAVFNDGSQPFLYPHFPGFSNTFPFQCGLTIGDSWREVVNDVKLATALRNPDRAKRIAEVAEVYAAGIHNLSERQPKPNVIICVFAGATAEQCRQGVLRVGGRKSNQKRNSSASLQQLLFGPEPSKQADEGDAPAGDTHHDLRRALKAEAMAFGLPTQILLEETFRPQSNKRQDAATTAWNFFTALYHKADGHPWRLADAQPGTCYVGISFFREFTQNHLRTSLAQAFTHTGDGFVLRGKPFEWDRSHGPSPHLSKANARDLLAEVIEVYKRHRNVRPERLVIHKSSRFSADEVQGFREALQNIPFWDLVAFGKRGTQFLRLGQYPPLRGSWVRFDDTNYLLYTQGYVPFLRTYPGMRSPQPQEILELFGTSPADTVMREILALTKLNWNSADFSCDEPITLAFSRRVGEILAELKPSVNPQKEYKFYM